MLRILDIPLHEISLDPAGASERLNAAAVHGAGLHVVGLAALGGRLRSRYDAGFSTLGVFELGPERWGLFQRTGADE